MAYFLSEALWWIFADVPVSSNLASFAFVLCCIFLWERLSLSVKLQHIIDTYRKDNG